MGFYSDFMGFYCDFMGFYSDFMGFYSDFMGFYSDFMGFYSDFMGFYSDLMARVLKSDYNRVPSRRSPPRGRCRCTFSLQVGLGKLSQLV